PGPRADGRGGRAQGDPAIWREVHAGADCTPLQRSPGRRRQSEARARRVAGDQNATFRPNWIWRGMPMVLEMVPAGPLPIVAFGRSNCGVLVRLKNSARNWTRVSSVIRKSLNTEKSTFLRPGPSRMFRPVSP